MSIIQLAGIQKKENLAEPPASANAKVQVGTFCSKFFTKSFLNRIPKKKEKKTSICFGGGHVLGIKKTSQIFHQPGWFLLKILGHQQPLYHSNLLKGISRVKEITSSCLGSYLPEVQDLAGLSSLEVPKFPPKKRYGYSSWWLVQPNPSEKYEN